MPYLPYAPPPDSRGTSLSPSVNFMLPGVWSPVLELRGYLGHNADMRRSYLVAAPRTTTLSAAIGVLVNIFLLGILLSRATSGLAVTFGSAIVVVVMLQAEHQGWEPLGSARGSSRYRCSTTDQPGSQCYPQPVKREDTCLQKCLQSRLHLHLKYRPAPETEHGGGVQVGIDPPHPQGRSVLGRQHPPQGREAFGAPAQSLTTGAVPERDA